MQLRRGLVLVAILFTLGSAATARAQAWNDGSPSRTRHLCWQGIYPAIPEDLAWVYAGFQGYPRVGEVYYVRVMVAGLGCSGAWVNPEIRLPPNTVTAVDPAHPIRCYLGDFSTTQPLSDGSCPATLSSYTSIGGGFIGIPPATQEYWPLPTGKVLRIEIPVVSSAPLNGIGGANDFVLGGAQFLDNSPGNPIPSYNAPPAGYTSGIPASGAWQGVFVAPAAVSYPTNAYFTFGEPSAELVPGGGAGLRARIYARAYFSNCFCDSNRYPLQGVVCQNPYPGSGAEQCCYSGGVIQRNVLFNMEPVVPPDNLVGVGGALTTSGSNPQYQDAYFDFDGVAYGLEYVYNYTPVAGALYDNTGAGCAATGNPPAASAQRSVTFRDPSAPTTYNLLTNVDGGGSVTLDPDGGVYAPGIVVIATATADTGYTFTGWRVDNASSGSSNPYAMTVNSDASLIAVFEAAAPTDDGGPTGGDGGPGAGDGPAGGDSGPGGSNENDDPGSDGGCNAAGPAIVELAVLAGALLLCRKR